MPKVIELPTVNHQAAIASRPPVETEVLVMERRRSHRYSVNLPCLVKLASTKSGFESPLFLAETVNASRSGFFFTTRPSPAWREGMEIESVIQLPIESALHRLVSIRCWGTIVRVISLPDGEVGVAADIEHFCLPAAIPKAAAYKRKRQKDGRERSRRKPALQRLA